MREKDVITFTYNHARKDEFSNDVELSIEVDPNSAIDSLVYACQRFALALGYSPNTVNTYFIGEE